jgi:hypothetical protein
MNPRTVWFMFWCGPLRLPRLVPPWCITKRARRNTISQLPDGDVVPALSRSPWPNRRRDIASVAVRALLEDGYAGADTF